MRRLRQSHVLNVDAPTSRAALSLGVASGVDAPYKHVRTFLIVVNAALSDAAAAGKVNSADVQSLGAVSGVASGVNAPL
jgi:hypothetical protein